MDLAKIKQRMADELGFDVDWEGNGQKVKIFATTPSELIVLSARERGFETTQSGIHWLASRLTTRMEGAVLMDEPVDQFLPEVNALWFEQNMGAALAVFNKAIALFTAQQEKRKAERKN